MNNLAKIEFIEEPHTYIVDGKEVPSVSAILQAAGMVNFEGIPADVLEHKRQFGTAIHKATELFDKNELNFKSLTGDLMPYIDAWAKFKKDFDIEIEPENVERHFYCREFRYCGTIDRIAFVNGQLSVIDIKTSAALAPSVAIQLAAYANGIEDVPKPIGRYAVRLSAAGQYKVEEFTNIADKYTFFAAVSLYFWRKSKNLLNANMGA
ncbi:MAG: PD-(D/E)XK nuclease family protein [Elusimicrobiota bacterium]|jgi:hypothetical protein|nr:PD-(D/E)XK nuclease family protein [Elusimicrobiota bacterium]